MLTNVMSLTPKIDEVREFIIRNEIDLALITETWLKESVSDTVVDILELSALKSLLQLILTKFDINGNYS